MPVEVRRPRGFNPSVAGGGARREGLGSLGCRWRCAPGGASIPRLPVEVRAGRGLDPSVAGGGARREGLGSLGCRWRCAAARGLDPSDAGGGAPSEGLQSLRGRPARASRGAPAPLAARPVGSVAGRPRPAAGSMRRPRAPAASEGARERSIKRGTSRSPADGEGEHAARAGPSKTRCRPCELRDDARVTAVTATLVFHVPTWRVPNP